MTGRTAGTSRRVRWFIVIVILTGACFSACTKGPEGPRCGDGVLDPGEVCDDGNAVSGDGCRDDCLGFELCGDGLLDSCEECDEGGETAECDTDCTFSECGDGTFNSLAESCVIVDVVALGGGGPYCGDGVVDTGAFPGGEVEAEECDGGGQETATCNQDCTRPRCGDGVVNEAAGEVCDGGRVATADCDVDCTAVVCGDGVVNRAAGEDCEQDSDCGPSFFCDLEPGREGCTCVL